MKRQAWLNPVIEEKPTHVVLNTILLDAVKRFGRHEMLAFNDENAVATFYQQAAGDCILQLQAHILGLTKERIIVRKRWPTDWWQAFKEYWFPAWALKRWPVTYEKIDIDQAIYERVCPHLQSDANLQHVHFFVRDLDKLPAPGQLDLTDGELHDLYDALAVTANRFGPDVYGILRKIVKEIRRREAAGPLR